MSALDTLEHKAWNTLRRFALSELLQPQLMANEYVITMVANKVVYEFAYNGTLPEIAEAFSAEGITANYAGRNDDNFGWVLRYTIDFLTELMDTISIRYAIDGDIDPDDMMRVRAEALTELKRGMDCYNAGRANAL